MCSYDFYQLAVMYLSEPCEFCEKWEFEIVNFVKNAILKMIIFFSKNDIFKM